MDGNRTTNLAYSPDGLVGSLEVVNASTSNQTTTFNWGTTLADSDVASSLLLRSVTYPDSSGGSDQVWLTYNRQRQRTSLTDQNGNVHQYVYDLLGRLTEDCVTTLGVGVDATVQRIERAYEVRGMVNRVTSFTSPVVGSGSVVNEVVWTYNNFRQSIQTYQAHFGAVNTSTTASVRTGYASGKQPDTIRPTSLTYPNGRSVTYNYGTSGGIADSASQIASFIDSDEAATDLADFSYLGLGTVVLQTSTQAHLQYTLVGSSDDPVTGDIYTGLDLFGRVKDNRWLYTSSVTDVSRTKYGYNRDSSRIWRANPTDPGSQHDWLYGYDGLQRVSNGTRGTLNDTQTAITSPKFAQCWQLDSTGNWQGFQQDDTGSGTWDQVQSRTASPVNEILQITDSATGLSATPTYDANGNLTGIPVLGETGLSWSTLTVDQWSALTTDAWSTLPVAPGNPCTYDAWNRLMSVTNGATAELEQQNQYDGRNYRTVVQNYTAGVRCSETRKRLLHRCLAGHRRAAGNDSRHSHPRPAIRVGRPIHRQPDPARPLGRRNARRTVLRLPGRQLERDDDRRHNRNGPGTVRIRPLRKLHVPVAGLFDGADSERLRGGNALCRLSVRLWHRAVCRAEPVLPAAVRNLAEQGSNCVRRRFVKPVRVCQ